MDTNTIEFLKELSELMTKYDTSIDVEMGCDYQGQYFESIDMFIGTNVIEFNKKTINSADINSKIEKVSE